jgi:hypothetical protein
LASKSTPPKPQPAGWGDDTATTAAAATQVAKDLVALEGAGAQAGPGQLTAQELSDVREMLARYGFGRG